MKVVLCSIPKAGTYMVGAIFEQLGLENSHLYLKASGGADDYSRASLDLGRDIPEGCQVRGTTRSFVAKLRTGQFAVTHLPHRGRRSLDGCRVVFLRRDLREAIVSCARMTHGTSRRKWNEVDSSWRAFQDPRLILLGFLDQHGDAIASMMLRLNGWHQEADVLQLRHEDLRCHERPAGADDVARVFKTIFPRVTVEELSDAIVAANRVPTITSNAVRTDFRSYWSDSAEAWFQQSGLAEFNHVLGYPRFVDGFNGRPASQDADRSVEQLRRSYASTTLESKRCPICERDEFLPVTTADRHGLGLKTVVCPRCGLAMTNPRPSDAWLEQFYREGYWSTYIGNRFRDLDDLFVRDRCLQRATQIVDAVAALLPVPPGSVIDIGAGQGGLLVALRNRFPDATLHGIEPSKEGVAFCRERHDIDVRQARIDDLPVENQPPADLVTLIHVLEHLTDPVDALKNAARMTAPGGRLYVEVPNVMSNRWFGHAFLHIAHLFNFTEQSLLRAGAKAGLKPVKVLHGPSDHWPWAVGVLFEHSDASAAEEPAPASAAEIRALRQHVAGRMSWGAALRRPAITWQVAQAAVRSRRAGRLVHRIAAKIKRPFR